MINKLFSSRDCSIVIPDCFSKSYTLLIFNLFLKSILIPIKFRLLSNQNCVSLLYCLIINLSLLNNKELLQSLYENSEYLLPTPLMNIMNGGAHANNGLDIQEFMIVPAGFGSFSESLRAGVEIFMNLKKILNNKKGYNPNRLKN